MKKFFVFVFLCFVVVQAFSQDTLPKISVTQLGKKVLVSWVNPFESVAAIKQKCEREYFAVLRGDITRQADYRVGRAGFCYKPINSPFTY